jgi:hypothetical protein
MDEEDALIIPLTDMIAASLVIGDDNVLEYLREVLDGISERPGAYFLEMAYMGHTAAIGTGAGDCLSGCDRVADVSYGGELYISLRLY